MTRHFQDIEVGERHEIGEYALTREEIRSFAKKYDPQPFHLDEEAASESIFGGLIASGWQTAAITHSLTLGGFFNDLATQGARGVDQLRWHQPVRPGDVLSVCLEVLEKDAHPSGLGTARVQVSTRNGSGDEVLSYVGLPMFRKTDE